MALLGDMSTFRFKVCLSLSFLDVAGYCKSTPTPSPSPMDLEDSSSLEQSEEEEATPPAAIEVQSQVVEEQLPSIVVVGLLDELEP